MTERYSRLAIYIHWIMAVMIIGMLIFGEDLMTSRGTTLGRSAHATIGISVLGLIALRILWRFASPPPALPRHMRSWEKALSHVSHAFLYALMALIPLSGIFAYAEFAVDHPAAADAKLFGLFAMPRLDWFPGWNFEAFHGLASNAMIGLVGLHALAALKHQFYDKDNLLARMKP
jgi:cytochrome b561